jgi:mycothiol synthase
MSDPQLRMVHRLRELPAPPILAPGYVLRTARQEDAADLAILLHQCFAPGDCWSEDRVTTEILQHTDVPLTWVVLHEGRIVATTSYQLQPKTFPNCGFLHYVAASQSHSGRRLGYLVACTVIHHCKAQGNIDARLTTDDWRLPAIATYLKLGFEPEPWHTSHGSRWHEVARQLKCGLSLPSG